VKPDTSN